MNTKTAILAAAGVVLVVFILAAVVQADEVKYEVTIEIKYNAVTPEDAERIVAEINRTHNGACVTEIKKRLLGQTENITVEDGNGSYFWSDDIILHDDGITLTPNVRGTRGK